ncbi:hypothetical protein LGL08_18350 [Clostridium estertheticum]|uniref:hypothetical protein n=1 Tax=Clostridium estertheticum TaxID=238834 RepID=UPI001CF2F097|nr:hypothetical protein [Clostridium estertheticum]MCB2308554.1 hypothetical protein [Clostridium estertheticum]MCB2346962.1 hypothetical protein [Clostridium estertheticum]MCB2351490.1 hypothetical protein [Clostridium estertheticum]WAG46573.1 hypothetical protein LL127_03200 [Clostridium estertheticum]
MLKISKINISRDHVTGFVVGVGVAATGYYLYMKNKDKVDDFLSNHGIKVPDNNKSNEDLAVLTLEELVLKKETVEDLIAEKELELESQVADAV